MLTLAMCCDSRNGMSLNRGDFISNSLTGGPSVAALSLACAVASVPECHGIYYPETINLSIDQ